MDILNMYWLKINSEMLTTRSKHSFDKYDGHQVSFTVLHGLFLMSGATFLVKIYSLITGKFATSSYSMMEVP